MQPATEIAEYTEGPARYTDHSKATEDIQRLQCVSWLFVTHHLKHSEAHESDQHTPTFWSDGS